jgi:hypothetical protein
VFDWARQFAHSIWRVKQVHFVVFLSDFIWHAARPGFDLVKGESLLVVPRLTHIYRLIRRESPWTTAAKTGDKHDKASVEDILDPVISILPGFDHFMLEEELVHSMHGLFWSIVPACIDPSLALTILPSSIDLRNDRLAEIVGVSDMDPVTCKLMSVIMHSIWLGC